MRDLRYPPDAAIERLVSCESGVTFGMAAFENGRALSTEASSSFPYGSHLNCDVCQPHVLVVTFLGAVTRLAMEPLWAAYSLFGFAGFVAASAALYLAKF